MLKRFALAVACALVTTSALADLAIEIKEVGSDVVFTAMGTLELDGLSPDGTFDAGPGAIIPSAGLIDFSTVTMDNYNLPIAANPGIAFGPGGSFFPATSRSGDSFALAPLNFQATLGVPQGYDGRTLSATMTFAGKTLNELGITPGTYEYSYSYEVFPVNGEGDLEIAPIAPGPLPEVRGSTITLTVVPEPSAFLHGGLISMLAGCGCWVRRRLV